MKQFKKVTSLITTVALLFTLIPLSSVSALSPYKEILEVTFYEVTYSESTLLSSTEFLVVVDADTVDVTSLTPNITVSENATISPNTGVAQDFSSPVSYTVTAEDGTTKDFLVRVEKAPLIREVSFTEQSNAWFNSDLEIIGGSGRSFIAEVYVPYGTDMSALTPQITSVATSISSDGITYDFSSNDEINVTLTHAEGTASYRFIVKESVEKLQFSHSTPELVLTSGFDGAVLTYRFSEESSGLIDDTIDPGSITMHNAPAGTSISNISVDGREVSFTMAYSGPALTSNIVDLRFDIDGSEILSGSTITTEDTLIEVTHTTYKVFRNNYIRFGTGSEDSLETNGNLQQPFYYDEVLGGGGWYKLTYSSYSLDNAIGVSGDGSSEYNTNGTIVENTSLSDVTYDYSNYRSGTGGKGYGSISMTGDATIGGFDFEITRVYTMGLHDKYIKMETFIKNKSVDTVENLRYWIGTRDDWIGQVDSPAKQRANIVGGEIVNVTSSTDTSQALLIYSGDSGVLFNTPQIGGYTVYNRCCSFSNVINTDPNNSDYYTPGRDGSYGVFKRMEDLAQDETAYNVVYYGAGPTEDLEEIAEEIPQAPFAPLNASVVRDFNKATVSFTEPIFDPNFPITEYRIIAQPGNIMQSVSTAQDVVFNNLDLSQSYTFYVYAINSVGVSQPAVTSAISTPNFGDTDSTDRITAIDIDVLANDIDAGLSSPLTITDVTQPTNGTVVNNGDDVTYTPNGTYVGDDVFTYTATDGVYTYVVSVTVTVIYEPLPPVGNNDNYTVTEDVESTLNVLSNDTDLNLDDLTVIEVIQPEHGTVTIEGGIVKYISDQDYYGADEFTYTVSDGDETTANDTATVVITVSAVNDAPDLEDDSASVDEDSAVDINVLNNDIDIDSLLTITSVTQGSHGTTVIEDGKVKYTPNENYFGSDTFTYTATDGGYTETATVTVTVNPVNDEPVINDDSATTNEDTEVLIDVLANDEDIDSTLEVSSVTQGTYGSCMKSEGKVKYTPNENFNGEDTFTYTVIDGEYEKTVTVNVTILSIKDSPIAANDEQAMAEDTETVIDVLANDSDPDMDEISIVSITQPENGLTEISEGQIRYVPAPNFNGEDTFTYTITDGDEDTSDVVATVVVTVLNVNDPVGARNDFATVNEDGEVSIDVLSNDIDIDENPNLNITMLASDDGNVLIRGGRVVFTPYENFNGEATITYIVSDGQSFDSATVYVTVNPINDAPETQSDFATTIYENAVVIDVLANDIDIDSEITIDSLTQPANGFVEIVEGKVVYKPNDSFTGTDSFTYTIIDGEFTVSTDVEVEVEMPENYKEDTTIIEGEDDEEDENKEIAVKTNPEQGDVEIVGDDIFYNPTDESEGVDTFEYSITKDGKTTDYKVVVNVVDGKTEIVGSGISLNDEEFVVESGKKIAVDVSEHITSPIKSTTVTINGKPVNGEAKVEDGKVIYSSDSDYIGDDAVIVTVELEDGSTLTFVAAYQVIERTSNCFWIWIISIILFLLTAILRVDYFRKILKNLAKYAVLTIVVTILVCLTMREMEILYPLFTLVGYTAVIWILISKKPKKKA